MDDESYSSVNHTESSAEDQSQIITDRKLSLCKPAEQVFFDDVLEDTCGTGLWQYLMISYLSLMWLLFPTLSMSMMFVGATPDYRCTNGFGDNYLTNVTYGELPDDTPKCHWYGSVSDVANETLELEEGDPNACTQWAFDKSVFESTVVTEWNLVCARKPLLSMLQSWLMIGGLVSSLVAGELTDRFGRKRVYIAAMLLIQACVYTFVVAPSYSFFAATRFVCGIGMTAMVGAETIMVVELTSPAKRATLCFLSVMPFAVGIMFVALASYLIRVRWMLQLAFAVPFVIYLPSFWILPETPRWLAVKGRFDEAYQVLSRAAKWNKRTMPPKKVVIDMMKRARDGMRAREAAFRKTSATGVFQEVLELVRTPRMRRNTLASIFIFFVIAAGYFGVSFDMTQLSSDPHLAAFLSGLAEIPAYFSFPLLNRFGRRISTSIFFLVASGSMFLVLVKHDPTLWLVVGFFAKFAISSAFNAVYVYISEYMPTPLRGLAFGACQTAVRLGATVSPFVVDLVSEIHPTAPSAVFGALVLLAGLVALLLPETNGLPMPETVADVESMYEKKSVSRREEHGESAGRKSGDGEVNAGYEMSDRDG